MIKNKDQIISGNPIAPMVASDYRNNPLTYASVFDKKEMSDIYARIGDIINMMKLTSSNEYKLSNSIEFFEISSDMRVNPLLMDLPLFSAYDTPNASSPSGWCDFSYTSRRGY